MNQPTTTLNRRAFNRLLSSSAVAAPIVASIPTIGAAAPSLDSPAEQRVGELYESLSNEQRKEICFGFDDDRRTQVNPNWRITQHKIGGGFYDTKQRELIDGVIRGITTEEGYERFQKQMTSDADGVENYTIAVFGDPTTDQFQWEMTGRHLTLRADGNSVAGAAFGGPLVYGHGVGNPRRNLFFHQTRAANEVFQSLDPKQAEAALLKNIPGEKKVQLQGSTGRFQGIAVKELSSDQKDLFSATLRTILAPYREADVDEAMAILEAGGGIDSLRMAFYSSDDLLNDKVWDLWRIEGPRLVCHFRGAPHVHAYINIGVVGSTTST